MHQVPSYTPKNTMYRPDGTGRDSYIQLDNGGFFNRRSIYPSNLHSQPKRFNASFKFSQKSFQESKPIMKYYYNDGSGRDSFISQNGGGQFKNYKDFGSEFENTLRSYPHMPSLNNKKTDYFMMSQYSISRSQFFQNQKKYNQQQKLLERLHPA